MGEKDPGPALGQQKRRLLLHVALAVVVALCAVYVLPYWIAEGPTVLVVVTVTVIAFQLYSAAFNSYELWKLRGTQSEEAAGTHDASTQG